MKNSIKIILLFFITQSLAQTTTSIPEWFRKNMEGSVGTWVTDNSKYQNENETMTSYTIDWKWGIGKTSITGELHGYVGEKKVGTFWQFRQYWDFEKNEGIVIQYGMNGVVGKGPIKHISGNETEMVQIFTTPSGNSKTHGHRSKLNTEEFMSSSFNIDVNGKWNVDRTYLWKRIKNEKNIKLGQLSLSLNVEDIKRSKSFYENLGFSKIDGNINQNWLILSDDTSRIGLFQGMFPNNTITFNPTNARWFYKILGEKNINIIMKTGMDKKEGKASFMIMDPDGNPILIDQHK